MIITACSYTLYANALPNISPQPQYFPFHLHIQTDEQMKRKIAARAAAKYILLLPVLPKILTPIPPSAKP